MRGKRLHILVLDDDPTITALLGEILGTAFSVTLANTIDEASAVLEVACPDLLLCDFRIDGGVSTVFLEAVAARHPAVRCVLMTGSPNREWRRMLELGIVAAALCKPFDLNQLWAVIRPIDETRRA